MSLDRSDSTMFKFNWYARKARDPQRDIWVRWSALHLCVFCYCELLHLSFEQICQRLIVPLQVGEGKPPTEAQLCWAVAVLEVERNRFLERKRAFDLRCVREKAQGRLTPTKSDWQELYSPVPRADQ